MASILETAMDLVWEGVSVIPLGPRDKKPAFDLLPKGADGKPTWEPFQSKIADAETLQRWFSDPTINLGIVCGAVSENLYVIDFDSREAAERFAETFASLVSGAPIVQTSRGWHIYLRAESPVAGFKGDGIEIKGEGGYVVGPGSTHPDGPVYKLVRGDLSKIPVVAFELFSFGSNGDGATQKEPSKDWADEALRQGVDKGKRDTTRTRLAGRYIAKGLSREETLELLLQFDGRCRPPEGRAAVEETLDSVLKTHDRKHPVEGQEEKPDPLKGIVSFRARQLAEIPPRTWFIEGMITPGFNMVASRKAMGKSFLMMQMAQAIAEGRELFGRKVAQTKVLYVSFELDEGDTSDRFKQMFPLSENAFILHTWSSGERAFTDAERAIKEYGFGVLMFDTFLQMVPRDPNFRLNEYGDSEHYWRWRMLAKRNRAAVVASWHTGKNEREDFFLDIISSTGLGAQLDCFIKIDRKRGSPEGKLFIGGNHAPDAVLPVIFEDGVFRSGEGGISPDRLTPDEEKTMAVLSKHPEGCATAAVALAMGKNEDAARMSLNRLMARGKVTRIKRGLYGLATLF